MYVCEAMSWICCYMYCKFGNIHINSISQFSYFFVISKFLNLQMSISAYRNHLLAITLTLRDNEFVNIIGNLVLASISEFTVSLKILFTEYMTNLRLTLGLTLE